MALFRHHSAQPDLFDSGARPACGSAPDRTDSTARYRWRVTFADREPLTVAFSPAATHAEVLDAYPDALAAEPIEPGQQQPDTLLAGDQEAAILAWLAAIGETDQATIAEVLARCRQDEGARQYFSGRAADC